MPAASELMMLSRLPIMPAVEHEVQIIGCRFVLARAEDGPKHSIVMQRSLIMNEPGLL